MPENGNPMSSIMGAVMSPVMGPVVRNPRGSSPLSITAQSNYYYLTSASPYDIGSTVSVADTEDAGGDYTVAITLTGGGTLTLAQTTGLTGSGDGTSTLSYTGTTTAINAALDGADIAGLSDETATMSITFTRNADSLATSRNVTVNAFPALAITTLDPADDATGTAYNRAAYTATFNRNIQAGTGNVVLKLVGGAALETFNIATGVGDQGGAVSISGADLVISPNVSLTDNTAHAIQIASTAIDGAQIGNADNFAGIADDTTWSFTCENTTPTLSSPLDSETGGTTATAAVTTDRGDGTLYWVVTTSATTPSHSQIVAGNDHTDTAATDSGSQAVTATGSQAVSGISGLTSETTYYTHFTQVSANSAAATPVSADGFTTDDITAPTIDSSVPADNATGVAVDSTIAITFDENVVFAYPGGGTLSLKLVGGATVETFTPSSTTAASGDNGGSVSISGAVVTITPGADMAAETAHCVRIDATCLEDGAGNAFAGIADDTTLNFTTEEVISDIYAVGGNSPAVVADFESATQYFRVGGSDETFANLFSFSRTGTATYVDSSGAVQTAATGVARTAHHVYQGGSYVKKGLLLETEARTNLVVHSGDFTQSAWAKSGGSVSGTTFTSVSATARISQDVTVASGVAHTVWYDVARNTGNDWVVVRAVGFDTQPGAWFNLNTGSVGTVGSGLTARIVQLSATVYRCIVTFTTTTDVSGNFSLYTVDGDNNFANTPGNAIDVYRAQVEAGSTASSYIPTTTTTATRNAEALTIAFADVPTIGSVHMKGTITYADLGTASQHTFWRQYKDADEYIVCDLDTDSTDTGEINFEQNNAGTLATITSDSLSPGINVAFNIASRHAASAINGAVSGTAGTEVTTASTRPTFTTESLSVGHAFMGIISLLRVWSQDIGDSGVATASS